MTIRWSALYVVVFSEGRRTKLRIEIVEECEHGRSCAHSWPEGDGHLFGQYEGHCPGGSRREASEVELLSLVADLAEKVWWCEEHEQSTESHRFCAEGVITGSKHRCRITERFLLPVGVLVDGPKEER